MGGAALAAVRLGRAYLVSALAAKGHLYVFTLVECDLFQQAMLTFSP